MEGLDGQAGAVEGAQGGEFGEVSAVDGVGVDGVLEGAVLVVGQEEVDDLAVVAVLDD